jgi:ABC-type cobalt transport system substrate-binding protein
MGMPVQPENISIKRCGQFSQQVKYLRSNTPTCTMEYIFPESGEISSLLFSVSYVLANALLIIIASSFGHHGNERDCVVMDRELT